MARRLIVGICAGICALGAAWLVWSALPAIERAMHTRPGDGVIDWLGARAWLAHVDIYSSEGLKVYGIERYGFAHPPTAPFWLLPFAGFEVDPFGTMMGWVTVVLLATHLVLTQSAVRLPGGVALAALGFGLVVSSSWFINDLLMAQVSEPIAFLYLLAWLALRARADRAAEIGAGIAIGLACTFKPFAGVLWLMLLALRRWRGAAAAIAAWLAIAIVMTSRFGLVAWRQWNGFNAQTAIVWMGHIRNVTLPGVVLRLFYPACRGTAAPRAGTTMLAVLLGAAILWLCSRGSRTARPGRPHDPQRIDLIFAAWSVASVFVNPVGWEHYAFVLVTPLWILFAEAFDPLLRVRDRILAAAVVVSSVATWRIDMQTKIAARDLYMTEQHGHLRLHLLEIASWLPWALVLVAALWLLRARDRALGAYGS